MKKTYYGYLRIFDLDKVMKSLYQLVWGLIHVAIFMLKGLLLSMLLTFMITIIIKVKFLLYDNQLW